MLKRTALSALTLGAIALAQPAFASFHLMQIEQVIGGVNGDTSRQAIQLRMRAGGQNQVQLARVRAWDAAGQNPVTLVDMVSPVAIGAAGARVLIATNGFLSPTLIPDFIMNPIPVGYLPAGKITFEDDAGTVWWGFAWGGASYTGTNTGQSGASGVANDADGNFNPPFAGALQSSNTQAIQFTGAASAQSTNNAADYALTAGAAVFTKNDGSSGTVPVELMEF
ncbi:MAG TPA: hypothetical protein VFQ51_14215, partial [Vicinamibacteria bacterium]|nr:hypothetical protein [Vicinamibacteria bacterium]